MLLAITLGVMCALFVMVVLWCRAAMRASTRRAEAAAKKKLDAQTWAAVKASRRKAQNDYLDRLTEATEASKPILATPVTPKSPAAQTSSGASLRSYGDVRIAKPAAKSTPARASRSYEDDSSYRSSTPSYDYGSSSSDYGSSSSDSYSGGSCSSSSDSGGGGGSCD